MFLAPSGLYDLREAADRQLASIAWHNVFRFVSALPSHLCVTHILVNVSISHPIRKLFHREIFTWRYPRH
jgi:hypothetical protein